MKYSETPIRIDTDLAVKIGLVNSVVLFVIREGNRAGIDYIEKRLSFLSSSTIKRSIKFLKQNNYITEISKPTADEIKEMVLSDTFKKNYCEWCGNKVEILHEHHFPIPRSKGGINTVKICPNCHYAYHHLEKQKIFQYQIGDDDE